MLVGRRDEVWRGTAGDVGEGVADDFLGGRFKQATAFEGLEYGRGKSRCAQFAAHGRGVIEQVAQTGRLARRALFDVGDGGVRGRFVV